MEATEKQIEILEAQKVNKWDLMKSITQIIQYADGTRQGVPPILAEILNLTEAQEMALDIYGVPRCRYCRRHVWHYEKSSEDGYSEHGRIHKQCRGSEAAYLDAQKAKQSQQMVLV